MQVYVIFFSPLFLYSYHQKYYLQNFHPKLVSLLGVKENEFVGSHLCTRLNGYVTCTGSQEEFEAQWPTLGLNLEQVECVRNIMRNGGTPGVCKK